MLRNNIILDLVRRSENDLVLCEDGRLAMIAFARAADAGKLIELLNGCLLTRRSISTDFNSTTRTSTTLINAGCAARVRNGLHVNIAF